MKSLFAGIILLSVLINGCSDSTGPNSSFTPYTVGSFRITSPTEGDWIGAKGLITTQGAAAGINADSISILKFNAPNGNDLRLGMGPTTFGITYIDSNSYYDGHVLYGDELSVSNFLSWDRNFTYGPYDDHWEIQLGLPDVNCDSTYNYNDQYLKIHLRPNNAQAKDIWLNVHGLTDAMKAMRCH